jgi:hypothetical protein
MDFFKKVFGEKKAYVILGHGGDTGEYNARQKVQEGYTFITNSTCGNAILGINSHEKLRKIQAFNKKVYTNPINHKSNINRTVQETHMFPPGSSVPGMSIQFITYFYKNNPFLDISPVGIFEIPTSVSFKNTMKKMDEINPTNIQEIIDSIFFHKENLLRDHFKKVLSPKIKDEIEKYKTTNDVKSLFLNLQVTYSIQELLEKGLLPKGVYYAFMCRSYGKNKINEKVLRTRRLSLNQQQQLFGKPQNDYTGLSYYGRPSTVSSASSVTASEESEDSEEEIVVPTPATRTPLPPTISHLSMYGKKPPILTRKRGGGDQYYRKDGPDYYVCFHKSGNCFPLDESENIQKAKAYLKAKENASRPNPALLNRSTRVAHMTRNMKHYNGPRGYNGASGVKNFGGKRRYTRKQHKA